MSFENGQWFESEIRYDKSDLTKRSSQLLATQSQPDFIRESGAPRLGTTTSWSNHLNTMLNGGVPWHFTVGEYVIWQTCYLRMFVREPSHLGDKILGDAEKTCGTAVTKQLAGNATQIIISHTFLWSCRLMLPRHFWLSPTWWYFLL